jgi:hypothetical protein
MEDVEAGCVGGFAGALNLMVMKALEVHLLDAPRNAVAMQKPMSKDLLNLNQGTVCPALLRPEQRGWVRSSGAYRRIIAKPDITR